MLGENLQPLEEHFSHLGLGVFRWKQPRGGWEVRSSHGLRDHRSLKNSASFHCSTHLKWIQILHAHFPHALVKHPEFQPQCQTKLNERKPCGRVLWGIFLSSPPENSFGRCSAPYAPRSALCPWFGFCIILYYFESQKDGAKRFRFVNRFFYSSMQSLNCIKCNHVVYRPVSWESSYKIGTKWLRQEHSPRFDPGQVTFIHIVLFTEMWSLPMSWFRPLGSERWESSRKGFGSAKFQDDWNWTMSILDPNVGTAWHSS